MLSLERSEMPIAETMNIGLALFVNDSKWYASSLDSLPSE